MIDNVKFQTDLKSINSPLALSCSCTCTCSCNCSCNCGCGTSALATGYEYNSAVIGVNANNQTRDNNFENNWLNTFFS